MAASCQLPPVSNVECRRGRNCYISYWFTLANMWFFCACAYVIAWLPALVSSSRFLLFPFRFHFSLSPVPYASRPRHAVQVSDSGPWDQDTFLGLFLMFFSACCQRLKTYGAAARHNRRLPPPASYVLPPPGSWQPWLQRSKASACCDVTSRTSPLRAPVFNFCMKNKQRNVIPLL